MMLPDPFIHTPMPRYPGAATEAEHEAFKARDSQVRMHNLARHVAAMPVVDERREFLKGMEKFHKPVFMVRFQRLMAWYYRRQRAQLSRTSTRVR